MKRHANKRVPPIEKVRLRTLTATDGKVYAGVELEYHTARGEATRRRSGRMMVPAPNEAGVASQREIAIAHRGLDEVAKHRYTRDWMRAQVRYKPRAAREIEQKREGGG